MWERAWKPCLTSCLMADGKHVSMYLLFFLEKGVGCWQLRNAKALGAEPCSGLNKEQDPVTPCALRAMSLKGLSRGKWRILIYRAANQQLPWVLENFHVAWNSSTDAVFGEAYFPTSLYLKGSFSILWRLIKGELILNHFFVWVCYSTWAFIFLKCIGKEISPVHAIVYLSFSYETSLEHWI